MTIPAGTDVLIAGGGNAALCAAIEARSVGADVVVLEHADPMMRGGNTRHTRNLRVMHDAPVATLTGAYTEHEFWEDLLQVTHGHTDEALARQMIRESEPLLEWLKTQGVHFQPALSGTLGLARTNAFFLGGGRTMLNALYQRAEALGVQVVYDTEVQTLDLHDGYFTGAQVRHRDRNEKIEARAVVVASGGFQANTSWLREAWGAAAEGFIVRGTPYNTGTLLRDLMKKGAATIGDSTQCHAIAVDARAPKFDGGIATRIDCICFSVVVNVNGQRFYDEGEDLWPRRYATWGRLIAEQPQQTACAIFDSKVRERFMPSVFPPEKADSIPELAARIGIDAESLSATINEFNAAVVDGNYDPDVLDTCTTRGLTPAKSHWALRLDTPPFYAYRLRPGITFTYLGLQVDAQARVLFDNGRTAPNIFAAGEIMAGNILRQGYCAGTGMTIGGVFGRIAGRGAACIAK
ncbi:MAG: FAD-dependent tricarballylate dehydrogenase TcuA [Gammaproteobacteria bacterium]|jgi:tricarballylate dehydrogenase